MLRARCAMLGVGITPGMLRLLPDGSYSTFLGNIVSAKSGCEFLPETHLTKVLAEFLPGTPSTEALAMPLPEILSSYIPAAGN